MRIILLSGLIALCMQAHAASGIDSAYWEYQVKPGDSLWSLADQHLASPAYVPRLQKLNHIADPYRLTPGSRVRVPYPWVKQQPSSARIEEFSGEVTAQDSKNQSLPINKETRYPKGVRFQTGNDAMLKLRFEDGSTLLMGANSSAQLQTEIYYPSTGSAKTEIRLDKGNAGSSVIPNILMPGRYQIRTPSAVTTVRGTEFRVSAESTDSTATEVLRGKVNVGGQQGGKVDVQAGFGTTTQQGAKPTAPEALPAAPDLSPLPAQSSFNPPLLQWTADQQAVAYRVKINGPGSTGQQLSERTVNGPQFYLSLPANGQYQLAARARNAHGLEGYDSSKTFELKAYPTPPLLLGTAGPQEIRGQTFSLHTTASPERPVQWQLSRQPDFSQISQTLLLTTPESKLTLPEDGQWYWRVAHVDGQGQPGPYSEIQSLLSKGLFSSLKPALPVLLARHYPVKDARYTLTLLAQADRQTVVYRNTAIQPSWPLSQLPKGQFLARLEIHGEAGYHAIEANEIIQLH